MTNYPRIKRFPVQTALRLTEQEYRALRAYAEAEDGSVAQLLRRGVRLVLASASEGDELADSDP